MKNLNIRYLSKLFINFTQKFKSLILQVEGIIEVDLKKLYNLTKLEIVAPPKSESAQIGFKYKRKLPNITNLKITCANLKNFSFKISVKQISVINII